VPPKRKGGFFAQEERPEDVEARIREVAAVLAPKRLVIQEVGEERILPNPFQARRIFTGLEDLANAIRVQGFTTRLRVRPDPDRAGFFQLVYGERRLRAARLAGLREIPCEIADHSNDEMIEIGLAENIQRQDLTPLEEAAAYGAWLSESARIRAILRIGWHYCACQLIFSS
jgi:ParB family chromosome partitioning protein